MLNDLQKLKRDIELAKAFEKIVLRIEQTNFDNLSEKQMRLEIKRIQKQARKAITERIF